MFELQRINRLDDYFVSLSNRVNRGIYFYRINACTDEVKDFIKRYYEEARCAGVVIEGGIPNPNQQNIMYYNEVMGDGFVLDVNFISTSLSKWLPRMNDYARNNVALAIYNLLDNLSKQGKSIGMLKNAYVKFMCWLYYRFERIVNVLGQDNIPKILYEGEVSNYELLLIAVLAHAGCDVVLLQYNGDASYLKLDPNSTISYDLQLNNMEAFSDDFSLRSIREAIKEDMNNARLYGQKPSVTNCTNAWIKGKALEDILTNSTNRGNDPKLFYNCFIEMHGVEDKILYANELFQFYQKLMNDSRNIVIVNGQISNPTNEEIAGINRKNYATYDQMLLDLGNNIKYPSNMEIQRIMHKAFIDIMLGEVKKEGNNLNKLVNRAVYLLCWLKRYTGELFSNAKNISVFIHMGECRSENEALFLRMLSRLPVDVLILNPNKNDELYLEDTFLYDEHYSNQLYMNKFPKDNTSASMGTAAYHAERELDSLMYQDTGMYRVQQYSKANSLNLQTMYEEIRILWTEELKYRPNFSTNLDTVNIPVICSKISGIKDGLINEYWMSIKELVSEDTLVIKNGPYIDVNAPNPMKINVTDFYKNGRVQKDVIKNNRNYKYDFLREDVQDYIIDKIQALIEQKIIKGTFENGTEYNIVSTILNLPMEVLRLIQKFDFTKTNPKLIYINTTERIMSIEDSIMIAFLNLIGFDILLFIPTGYQNVEKFFNKRIMEEHQIGEYKYDLQIPNIDAISLNTRRGRSWRDRFFKKGR